MKLMTLSIFVFVCASALADLVPNGRGELLQEDQGSEVLLKEDQKVQGSDCYCKKIKTTRIQEVKFYYRKIKKTKEVKCYCKKIKTTKNKEVKFYYRKIKKTKEVKCY